MAARLRRRARCITHIFWRNIFRMARVLERRPRTSRTRRWMNCRKAARAHSLLTTEIDDAFSVEALTNGRLRIGIHIAAPALGIARGDFIDSQARVRLSTVYAPGEKITMLPETVVEQFTLKEGGDRPALSLYLIVDG